MNFRRVKRPFETKVSLTNLFKKSKIISAFDKNMKFNKESAVREAKTDLAGRLKISEGEIKEVSVDETDFPDMSLGAPAQDEMAAQMISTGWRINLNAAGKNYEYRADKYQLRLRGFNGTNYLVKS